MLTATPFFPAKVAKLIFTNANDMVTALSFLYYSFAVAVLFISKAIDNKINLIIFACSCMSLKQAFNTKNCFAFQTSNWLTFIRF
jgi:hypothetical protein